MIKSEPYGGGTRWHCTKCDTGGTMPGGTVSSIKWANGTPPDACERCVGQITAFYQAKLDEEKERFGVTATSWEFVEHNIQVVLGLGVWKQLAEQLDCHIAVVSTHDQDLFVIVSEEDVIKPTQFTELAQFVDTLEAANELAEKAEEIELYEGPYQQDWDL